MRWGTTGVNKFKTGTASVASTEVNSRCSIATDKGCNDAAGAVSDQAVPSECELTRQHLPGHLEGAVEPSADHQQGVSLAQPTRRTSALWPWHAVRQHIDRQWHVISNMPHATQAVARGATTRCSQRWVMLSGLDNGRSGAGAAVDLLIVDRSEPGRSPRAGDCPHLQDGSTAVRGDSAGVDTKICSVLPSLASIFKVASRSSFVLCLWVISCIGYCHCKLFADNDWCTCALQMG